jgi:hypothetical protein
MFLRNEASIHRPRGLSVLYCPFSDGTPLRDSKQIAKDLDSGPLDQRGLLTL